MATHTMQQNCYSGQAHLPVTSDGCDFFPGLEADFRTSEFVSHVELQHPQQSSHRMNEDQGHMLPPVSSFSQSFASPGQYRPNYHSFNESPENDATTIDYHHILSVGCDPAADKSVDSQSQQVHQQQEYGLQSFASQSLLYSNFSSDVAFISNNPEVTMDSSNIYLTTDSHVVGNGANSFYGAVASGQNESSTSYFVPQQPQSSDYSTTSHSIHNVSPAMDTTQSSHMQHLPDAGYSFQSPDRVPVPQSSHSVAPVVPRSTFSHPFTSSDFFSFGIEDAETSESLIDLQSTLDLLPPTPQPVQQSRGDESVLPRHANQKDFATHSQNFVSSGAFSFLDEQTPLPEAPNKCLSAQNGHLKSNQMPDSPDSLIQQVECFKCKLCDFLCLERSGVLIHISKKHNQSESTLTEKAPANPVAQSNNNNNTILSCSSCSKSFTSLEECTKHMASDHQITSVSIVTSSQGMEQESSSRSPMESIRETAAAVSSPVTAVSQSIPSNASHFLTENSSLVQPRSSSPTGTSKAAPKPSQRKPKNNLKSNNDSPNANQVKGTSNKKIAWQAKVAREQGAYVCSKKKCSVRFYSLENMQRHEKCHLDDGSGFACCECDKFRSEHWSSCAGHLWREHSIDLELHKCELCSYRSYSLSVLENIHKKIHSNEKNYVCNICSKAFKNQKQLVNHKVRHDKKQAVIVATQTAEKSPVSSEEKSITRKPVRENRHECELCGKVFPEHRPLRIHMDMVHKKKRPYLCMLCFHSAASKGALRVHVRSHTGEKPFKCEECDYSTSDHNSLRRHKMRHSGERPYKCPFCSYACIQSSTYKQHLRNKHPNESDGVVFTCSSCGFKTVNEEIFRTHTTEHEKKATGVRFKRAAASRSFRHSRSDGESSSSSSSSSLSPTASLSSSPESPIMQLARGIVGMSHKMEVSACVKVSEESSEIQSNSPQLLVVTP